MKVIEKGRQQKGWSREFNCTGSGNGAGGCGARLLVEQGDVFETKSSHHDGSVDSYATFKCSECGVLTDIPEAGRLPFTPRRRTENER